MTLKAHGQPSRTILSNLHLSQFLDHSISCLQLGRSIRACQSHNFHAARLRRLNSRRSIFNHQTILGLRSQ